MVAAIDESKAYTDTQLTDYSTATQMTQAISDALVPFETAAQRDAAISLDLQAYYTSAQTDAVLTAGLSAFSTTVQMNQAITDALLPFETAVQRDAAISLALQAYYTSAQTDAALAAALGSYYTSAQTDAAIAAAVALSNGQSWTGGPTFNLLRGTNVLRNLSVAGALTASFQNLDDTILIESDSYARSETYTQLETGAAITAAIDALNLSQYRTEAQVLALIAGELVPYWDQTEVSTYVAGELSNYATSSSVTSAISSALSSYDDSSQVDSKIITALLDFYTRTEVDQQITNALGNVDLSNYYTQAETQSYVASELLAFYPRTELDSLLTATLTQYWPSGRVREIDDAIAGAGFLTQALADQRYFAVSANASFESLVRTNVTPPMIKALLPRAPLAASTILTETTLELTCDAYTKAESDGRYLSNSNFVPLDARYFVRNPAVAEGNGIFHLVQEQFTPRFIRSLLFRPPLTGGAILGNGSVIEIEGGLLEQGAKRQPLPPGGHLQLARQHGHVHRRPREHPRDGRRRHRRPRHRPGEQRRRRPHRRSDGQQPHRHHLRGDAPAAERSGRPPDPERPGNGPQGRWRAAGQLRRRRHQPGPGRDGGGGQHPERHHGGHHAAHRGQHGGNGRLQLQQQRHRQPGGRQQPPARSAATTGLEMNTKFAAVTGLGDPGGFCELAVINQAPTGVARLFLSTQNNAPAGGRGELVALANGGVQLNALNQNIALNTTGGTANLVIEPNTGGASNGEVICFYGFQNLSDERLKTNVQPLSATEAQELFDGVEARSYDRVDGAAQQTGFVAQEVYKSGPLGKSFCKLKNFEDRELMTLDYQRMTAVLWQTCKSLQRRIEKLEKKKRGRSG